MSYNLTIGGGEISVVRTQGTPNAVFSFGATGAVSTAALGTALPGTYSLQWEQDATSLVQYAMNVAVIGYVFLAGTWRALLPYASVGGVYKRTTARGYNLGTWK